ncbi:integrase, partial [Lactobacillus crispatus]|nr:integrase [Lactobacillus crispatus]MBI1709411.1 integrase [Lactobacillus crispatus]MBI1711592.1 integrase [Lactobacillus crispatus]MBI1715991.1 integrase [Lactobacillus crispatus]
VLLSVCVFFVQTNHTRKELLFLMFKEINLRNHSSLHKLFYSLGKRDYLTKSFKTEKEAKVWSTTLELQKAKGQAIAQQNTLFKDFYYLFVQTVKVHDVRKATFDNYVKAGKVIDNLFPTAKLGKLDDVQMQSILDKYGKTHSKKTVTELLKKIRTALRYAYVKGYIYNDFASLLKAHGKELPKRNKASSMSDLTKLKHYLLEHTDNEFNLMVLLEISTGLRRGEILGIKPEDVHYDGQYYCVEVKRSISPTTDDTKLKTKHSRRSVTIPKNIYDLLKDISQKDSGYLFDWFSFKQSGMLKELLKKIGIPSTTFHGLRDTHASFLFSNNIPLSYVSRRLGHDSILTTEKYYLELMPEKKHSQDANALNLLESL